MSTRSTIYYEENGIHIYHELMDGKAYLEYSEGSFLVNIPVSDKFLKLIEREPRK